MRNERWQIFLNIYRSAGKLAQSDCVLAEAVGCIGAASCKKEVTELLDEMEELLIITGNMRNAFFDHLLNAANDTRDMPSEATDEMRRRARESFPRAFSSNMNYIRV
uniref:Uncharacterized protein n=1 Tax=Hemiselmis andersenii TaxID=464988 RepID=A0A6U4YXM9_HEMAN|mmetsp:Transcript_6420/g.14778  ORF Transcript_6420/g.14778 Transcript_6420/m.14778 type:complete len:107 (+) Transcript_6420:259-579(+)